METQFLAYPDRAGRGADHFGAGRLPQVMGDLGKGVKSFKAGLTDDKPDQTKLPPSTRRPDRPPDFACST